MIEAASAHGPNPLPYSLPSCWEVPTPPPAAGCLVAQGRPRAPAALVSLPGSAGACTSGARRGMSDCHRLAEPWAAADDASLSNDRGIFPGGHQRLIESLRITASPSAAPPGTQSRCSLSAPRNRANAGGTPGTGLPCPCFGRTNRPGLERDFHSFHLRRGRGAVRGVAQPATERTSLQSPSP